MHVPLPLPLHDNATVAAGSTPKGGQASHVVVVVVVVVVVAAAAAAAAVVVVVVVWKARSAVPGNSWGSPAHCPRTGCPAFCRVRRGWGGRGPTACASPPGNSSGPTLGGPGTTGASQVAGAFLLLLPSLATVEVSGNSPHWVREPQTRSSDQKKNGRARAHIGPNTAGAPGQQVCRSRFKAIKGINQRTA